ncbi:MAG TPA: lipoprotein signal peptidase [Bacteroidia bacterium]|nr:lipoprotein signal peptidase [Bacteroidia bacterium]
MKKPLLLAFLVLLIDQLIKVYIKTHFTLEHTVHVAGNWFIINFVENNGMAYGMELGGQFGKLALSSFRIIAVIVIFWYLLSLIKKKEDNLFIICIALIFAGALGNIIDSVFYGVLFSESTFIDTAKFLPAEGGYSSLLHGKVVDMFYFPIIEGHFPDWVPYWGTERFVFFQPVFNFADASITVGVAIIVLYQRRFFGKKKQVTEEEENPTAAEEPIHQNP